MKILCISLWDNTWIEYWTKFLESRGHQVDWEVSNVGSYKTIANKVEWCDAILSMWAVGWPNILTKVRIDKPLFVIHRSFESFGDAAGGLGKIEDVDWSRVERLFMLNESHYAIFSDRVPKVEPTFIKNGIDLDIWKLQERDKKSIHKIAWVANINHKKGEQLAIHSVKEIMKIDSLVQLCHVGNIQSVRIVMYMQNIAPYMNYVYSHRGWVEGKEGMVDFLKQHRYILCTSLVEGHPMNILEGMATGCKPLIHRYPGVESQFPEKYIWTTFDDLRRLYSEPYNPEEYRQYIIDNYDYKKVYEPVAKAIEDYAN